MTYLHRQQHEIQIKPRSAQDVFIRDRHQYRAPAVAENRNHRIAANTHGGRRHLFCGFRLRFEVAIGQLVAHLYRRIPPLLVRHGEWGGGGGEGWWVRAAGAALRKGGCGRPEAAAAALEGGGGADVGRRCDGCLRSAQERVDGGLKECYGMGAVESFLRGKGGGVISVDGVNPTSCRDKVRIRNVILQRPSSALSFRQHD